MADWSKEERQGLIGEGVAQNQALRELLQQNAEIIGLLQHQNEVLDWLAGVFHRRGQVVGDAVDPESPAG
jgi:hypothetical protein